jgi:hypothetical protein
LELWVAVVAFVIGAGDGGQLEGADVACAHHVWTGAEIDEIAILIIGDGFALWDLLNEIELELARLIRPFGHGAESSSFGIGDRLFSRNLEP